MTPLPAEQLPYCICWICGSKVVLKGPSTPVACKCGKEYSL